MTTAELVAMIAAVGGLSGWGLTLLTYRARNRKEDARGIAFISDAAEDMIENLRKEVARLRSIVDNATTSAEHAQEQVNAIRLDLSGAQAQVDSLTRQLVQAQNAEQFYRTQYADAYERLHGHRPPGL